MNKSNKNIQMFNPVYHVFCFRIDGIWYRTPEIFDDYTFEELMEMLSRGLPYNMKVFHFNSNEHPPVSKNIIFNALPIIEINLTELFETRIGVKLKKSGQKQVKVLRFSSGFFIIETNDNYGRFLKLSESDEMFFEEYYPIPFAQVRKFINKHHRHNSAPQGHKFSIGLLRLGKLVGVIVASTPKARLQNDGFTLELNRCCVLPEQPNACSKLYAKAISAGRSMGYRRFITYTLPHESGSSLKAVGFKFDGFTQSCPKGWNNASRPRQMPKRYPTGQKCRWILYV